MEAGQYLFFVFTFVFVFILVSIIFIMKGGKSMAMCGSAAEKETGEQLPKFPPVGVSITIMLKTSGAKGKGSAIWEEFFNQPIEKVREIENFFQNTVRPKIYSILIGRPFEMLHFF